MEDERRPTAEPGPDPSELFTFPGAVPFVSRHSARPMCAGMSWTDLHIDHREAHEDWDLARLAPDSVARLTAALNLIEVDCPEAVRAWTQVPIDYPVDSGGEATGCVIVLRIFSQHDFATRLAAVQVCEHLVQTASLDRDGARQLMTAWLEFGAWLDGFDYPCSTLAVDAADRLIANTPLADLRQIAAFKSGAIGEHVLTGDQLEYVEFMRACTTTSIPALTRLYAPIARVTAREGNVDTAMAMLGASIASGSPVESDYDELSWLCERTGDFQHAAVIAQEGLAEAWMLGPVADRLQRRSDRCRDQRART